MKILHVALAHGQREPESVARSHASDAELSYTRVVVSAIGHRKTEHRETFVAFEEDNFMEASAGKVEHGNKRRSRALSRRDSR